jgi:hypothetical protein
MSAEFDRFRLAPDVADAVDLSDKEGFKAPRPWVLREQR